MLHIRKHTLRIVVAHPGTHSRIVVPIRRVLFASLCLAGEYSSHRCECPNSTILTVVNVRTALFSPLWTQERTLLTVVDPGEDSSHHGSRKTVTHTGSRKALNTQGAGSAHTHHGSRRPIHTMGAGGDCYTQGAGRRLLHTGRGTYTPW